MRRLLDQSKDELNYGAFFGFCISENNLLITGCEPTDASSVKKRLVPLRVSMEIENVATLLSADAVLRGTDRQSVEATNW